MKFSRKTPQVLKNYNLGNWGPKGGANPKISSGFFPFFHEVTERRYPRARKIVENDCDEHLSL